ncbi:unnamed protein product [Ixodes hexagonus]
MTSPLSFFFLSSPAQESSPMINRCNSRRSASSRSPTCELVFLLDSMFSMFLPISSMSESSSELESSSVDRTSWDDSTRFWRSKMRWHSSL